MNNEEINNKKIMNKMWAMLVISLTLYTLVLVLVINILSEGLLLGIIIVISTVIFLLIGLYLLKLELSAGYYECKKCLHRFKPTYKEMILSFNISTTRYLKCPKCHQRTWAKKKMSK